MTITTARTTASFIDTLGVNTHIDYTDGKYAAVNNVISDLKYLGITRVREHNLSPFSDPVGQRHLGLAADAGITFDFIINGKHNPVESIARIEAFMKAHPGSVFAIEGPNEISHNPFSYQGLSGDAAAALLQKDLYALIKASPELAGVEVYSYSLNSTSRPTGGYDAVALHPYPQNGDEPGAWLANEMKYAPAGAGSVITEAGYSTLPSWWKGVDYTTQAKLTLNMLFDSMKLGIEAIYLYELLDAYADPTGSNGERHYGLFDIDNKPKPVAVAIHNLTTILADTGAGSDSFTAGALDFTLTGMPATASNLLLQKSNGDFELVVWNEPDIWNQTTHAAITVAPTTVTLSLDRTYTEVRVYDPLVGTEAVATYRNVSSISLSVTDHPLIVEIGPASVRQGTIKADKLTALASGEAIDGLAGNDTVNGAAARDQLTGGLGNDLLYGNGGDDFIWGNLGSDKLFGGTGADTLDGGDEADRLDGGEGADALYGMAGDDVLIGGLAADRLWGGDGVDDLTGGEASDVLYGEDGNDRLFGGGAADVMTGGLGADRFVFTSLADSRPPDCDLICDFGTGDTVDLSGIDASTKISGNQAFVWAVSFSKVAGQAVLTYDAASNRSTLSLDANGDGVADFALLMTGQVSKSVGTWIL